MQKDAPGHARISRSPEADASCPQNAARSAFVGEYHSWKPQSQNEILYPICAECLQLLLEVHGRGCGRSRAGPETRA